MHQTVLLKALVIRARMGLLSVEFIHELIPSVTDAKAEASDFGTQLVEAEAASAAATGIGSLFCCTIRHDRDEAPRWFGFG